MKVALSEEELIFIQEKVTLPLSELGAEVYIFGSRAKFTHSKYSDLDILVKSNQFESYLVSKVSEIKESLIQSNFPYKVDIVLNCDLVEEYRSEIESVMIQVLPDIETQICD